MDFKLDSGDITDVYTSPILQKDFLRGQRISRAQERLRRFPAWLSHLFFFGISFATFYYLLYKWNPSFSSTALDDDDMNGLCPQYDSITPDGAEGTWDTMSSLGWRNESITLLSEAVKIKTESWDDEDEVGNDERWDVFYQFSEYLKNAFPLLHSTLTLTRVNTHGLVYTWEGSDKSKKPIMLMAHQDTVPVNMATLDQWDHRAVFALYKKVHLTSRKAPWSGHYDGTFVWGRGSSDCKTLLISELQAVTLLIKQGFTPRRTVILSFGFDEESWSAFQGAGKIGEYLLEKYGEDSIEIIVDEGGMGVGEFFGQTFALPGAGEKGYVDVNITLSTKGGHSSVPPAHTGIGIISRIVTTLEANPHIPDLIPTNPYYTMLKCGAEHSPDFPLKLKSLVKMAETCPQARKQLEQEIVKTQPRATEMLFTTSQAVDIVGGGVKVNALPELTFVVVNHRIRPGSTPEDVMEHVASLIDPIAEEFSLDVDAFGTSRNHSSSEEWGGALKLAAINPLDPAPVSPPNDAWAKLSGTIRHVYESDDDPKVVVAPAIMTGNTDTRFMWPLTKSIYRFSPSRISSVGLSGGVHTVNEHLSVDGHIRGTYFIHSLIRNFD
ncbi:carboxypeptidase S [Atractiella rhizophila]|nr:carboxypeptidase S [Atractiella rhizophila]